MAAKDRNALKLGIGAILGGGPQVAGDALENDVALVSRGGRPPKGFESAWDKKRNKVTSIVFDVNQHNEVKKLSNYTGVSFKELVFILINEGLQRYKSGDLKIENNRLL